VEYTTHKHESQNHLKRKIPKYERAYQKRLVGDLHKKEADQKSRRNRHKEIRKRCKLQQECRRKLRLHDVDHPVDGGSTFPQTTEYVY